MNKTEQRLIDMQRQIVALMNQRDRLNARLQRAREKKEKQSQSITS